MNLFQVTKKQPSGGLEIKTFTGNPVTFTPKYSEALPAPFNGINLKAQIVATQASGTPTPSNPLPISGISSLEIVRCGVNLWDEETRNGYYNNSGVFFDLATSLANKNPIKVKPNTTYYCHCGSAFQFFVFTYDENGDFISRITTAKNATFTTPANCEYIGWCNGYGEGGTYANDISINSDSADTSYHAYNGQTFTIDLGGTRYGGVYTADGKFDDTYSQKVNLADLSWNYQGQNCFYATVTGAKTGGIVKSNHYQYTDISIGSSRPDLSISLAAYYGDSTISIKDDNYSDVPSFVASLTGGYCIYEFATPIEIDVSSISVVAQSGVNNITSNGGGDVEVKCLI